MLFIVQKILAIACQRTVFAVGTRAFANVSAVKQNAVMAVAPQLGVDCLIELLLRVENVLGVGKTYPITHAENVRVHGYGLSAESHGVDDVRRLAPHSRKGSQLVNGTWHLRMKPLHQVPARLEQKLGFMLVKTAGIYNFFQICLRN